MQKIINVLALASSVVSLAVVGTAGYVYVQRDAIIEDIKEKAMAVSYTHLRAHET